MLRKNGIMIPKNIRKKINEPIDIQKYYYAGDHLSIF